jgi:hypothetical protein
VSVVERSAARSGLFLVVMLLAAVALQIVWYRSRSESGKSFQSS